MLEFELHRHFYSFNDALDALVRIPPGDDMACLRLPDSHMLAATDQVIDRVHVDSSLIGLALIGRKAVARSVSDIAAMAAKPVASLATGALPPGFSQAEAKVLFDAMRMAANELACPLVGGDVAALPEPGDPFVLSVTVLAVPDGIQPITRAGARPGDRLYVTGELGGTLDQAGGGHHLTFTPRVAEARLLVQSLGDRLHGMIDLSDGLGSDATHIAERSDVAIQIDVSKIPRRSGATWQQAAGDGEDYELCFAASGDVPSELNGLPVTLVGEVISYDDPVSPRVVFIDGDQRIPGDTLGWQHGS